VSAILAPKVGLEIMQKSDLLKNTKNDLKSRLIMPIWCKIVFLFIRSNIEPKVHGSKGLRVY
jgi:hypothetical protein